MLGAVVFFCGHTTYASSFHRESASAYARAENIRHRLLAKPVSARTRRDFERALDAYRAVYHGDPASPDAGRSIAAVADLLAEEGRSFHEAKLSHDAVAQWAFLRQEYPGNALRQRALFAQAQIEQHDLYDRAAAKKIYRDFLVRYPHDPLAEQARAEMQNSLHYSETSTKPRAHLVADRVVVAAEHPPSGLPIIKNHPAQTPDASPRFQNLAVSEPVSKSRRSGLANDAHSSDVHSGIVQSVRYWTEGGATRLAIDMNEAIPYHAYLAPDGKQITLIFFGAHASEHLTGNLISVGHDENLRAIRASVLTNDQAELVLELKHPALVSSFTLSNPDRLILDLRAAPNNNSVVAIARNLSPNASKPHREYLNPPETFSTVDTNPEIKQRTAHIPAAENSGRTSPGIFPSPAWPAEPTDDGQRSMARVLGLRIRRIVIDAGHGGHDSGTLGPGGLEEKDVALDVALRLGNLLHRQLGADVIYTRRTDKFVPLEERTAIANRAHADLFLSIHANSSADPDVRGVETYFLNFTASPDALQVAARENAISNRSVHELSDLVRRIALSDKIDESREFAANVQQSLYSGLASSNNGLRNRGVKQAPFVVLIGANMPSILAEISFLTNPEDASELAQPAYRERLAEALYRGVAQYVEGMSGVRVAKTAQPEAPQTAAE